MECLEPFNAIAIESNGRFWICVILPALAGLKGLNSSIKQGNHGARYARV
jgi:hypothetical protein